MSKIYTSVIIGSGFSGLCMAIKLKEKNIHNFVILEKAASLGGTWRENTYPGAECDVPSALYSYSFEPYPHWEYKWSHQDQILAYLEHCAKKYKLSDHIHFQKEMTAAEWDDSNHIWHIQTADGSLYQSKSFIPAIGQLHHPSIPSFEGKDQFKGHQFHSAKWDHSISLDNKTIGVIGNAASAIQFIPQIAKTAKGLVIFQRSANWMLPKQDRLYKEWEKKLVRRFPILLKLYRLKIWLLGGVLFLLMKKGNGLLRSFFQWQSKRYIRQNIDEPKLREQLIPKFPLGARRVLFSDDYYQTLNQQHIQLTTDSIYSIAENGIITQNENKEQKNHQLDIIVYATGFKTNPFLLGLDIKGANGISIKEVWKEEPINYLGITITHFPNLFLMYGPNTNLGHNSIILMSEAQANYITQCIVQIEKNNWKSMTIKADALQSYYNAIQDRLQNMIWAQIKNSWYQTASGQFPNNWPGRTMEYMRKTKKVDFAAYIIVK